MKLLFDTNICIALIKQIDSDLKRKLSYHSISDFALCSVVKAELIFGARNSRKVSDNIKHLHDFFSRFQSFDFDDAAAEHYGAIRSVLTKEGSSIGPNDLMIASIALANNFTLVTRNEREFTRVPTLKVEVW